MLLFSVLKPKEVWDRHRLQLDIKLIHIGGGIVVVRTAVEVGISAVPVLGDF